MIPVMVLFVAPDGQNFAWKAPADAPAIHPFLLAAAALRLQAIANAQIGAANPSEPQIEAVEGVDQATIAMLKNRNGLPKR